jgi:hypothetical protein
MGRDLMIVPTGAPAQPVPFEIVRGAAGLQVASNGHLRVLLPDEGGRLFRRRGIHGIRAKPPAEQIVPQLNAMAGELLQQPDTPAQEVIARLTAIAGTIITEEPRRTEWLVAELNGVFIYTDGEAVVITTKEMVP